MFTIPCNGNPCSTGQCDPSTGNCVAGNEGGPCDDGNVCTHDDQCHNGQCIGTSGTTPPTATPGSPTPTPSATMVPTPTRTVPPCVGACNGDGQVTVDEIVTLVNLALNGGTSGCSAGDANGDGQITVDEIVSSVNYALNGCPRQ